MKKTEEKIQPEVMAVAKEIQRILATARSKPFSGSIKLSFDRGSINGIHTSEFIPARREAKR